jgi:molecular chaperone GrpE (heat shock protein)
MLGKLTTTQQDIESVAAQLAELTRSVNQMASQLTALRDGAEKQQERADTQQERIDLAAKELTEVSDRLQAAANALRQSV